MLKLMEDVLLQLKEISFYLLMLLTFCGPWIFVHKTTINLNVHFMQYLSNCILDN